MNDNVKRIELYLEFMSPKEREGIKRLASAIDEELEGEATFECLFALMTCIVRRIVYNTNNKLEAFSSVMTIGARAIIEAGARNAV